MKTTSLKLLTNEKATGMLNSCGLKVGLTGFEPAAPRPPDECATKLRHNPMSQQSVDASIRYKR